MAVLEGAPSPADAPSQLENLRIEENEASDSDGGAAEGAVSGKAGAAPSKQKKRKPKKKKSAAGKEGEAAGTAPGEGQTSQPVKLAPTAKATGTATQQTEPPTVPVSHLFPNKVFPEGQICEYADK